MRLPMMGFAFLGRARPCYRTSVRTLLYRTGAGSWYCVFPQGWSTSAFAYRVQYKRHSVRKDKISPPIRWHRGPSEQTISFVDAACNS